MTINSLHKKNLFHILLTIAVCTSLYMLPSCYSNNLNNATQLQAQCTFCDIILGSGAAVVWEENDDVIVIGKPQRAGREATDLLIIPKRHRINLKYLNAHDAFDATILSKMGFMAQHLAQQLTAPGDFWVEIHNGSDAFQSIMHLHMHFKSHSTWANTHKKPIRIQ